MNLLRETRRHGALALAVAILVGTIGDRTTGQPLTDVEISAHGPATATAHSNAAGKFSLRGLAPGHYTLTLSSDDVPPQTFEVMIGPAKSQHHDFTACSTTLDYSCAPVTP